MLYGILNYDLHQKPCYRADSIRYYFGTSITSVHNRSDHGTDYRTNGGAPRPDNKHTQLVSKVKKCSNLTIDKKREEGGAVHFEVKPASVPCELYLILDVVTVFAPQFCMRCLPMHLAPPMVSSPARRSWPVPHAIGPNVWSALDH